MELNLKHPYEAGVDHVSSVFSAKVYYRERENRVPQCTAGQLRKDDVSVGISEMMFPPVPGVPVHRSGPCGRRNTGSV